MPKRFTVWPTIDLQKSGDRTSPCNAKRLLSLLFDGLNCFFGVVLFLGKISERHVGTFAGITDVFVTKLDAGGNFNWAKKFGGANDDRGNGVAVDSVGNALIIADTAAGGSGTRDASICKLDPDGNTIWSRVVGASSSIPTKGKATPTGYAGGTNITVDAAGNVYATGYMNGTVDFDAGTGTTAASGLAFVMKLNSAGTLTWARAFEKGGSPTSAPQVSPSDIAVDANGTVYSTGSYILSVDFDPGTQKSQKFFLNAGSRANYVSALDSGGNFLWTKSTRSIGTANTGIEAALAMDGVGGVYVAGSFNGTIDFDPGASTFALYRGRLRRVCLEARHQRQLRVGRPDGRHGCGFCTRH